MKQTELNTLVINNIHSSKQNYRISSFIISLPFCWALITAVYLCLTFLGGGYVTALLGLFVPIGLMNFVLLLESGPLIVTLPLVLLTVFVGSVNLKL